MRSILKSFRLRCQASVYFRCAPLLLAIIAVATTVSQGLAADGDENLWITSVVPSTGAVEVTNVGSSAVTLDGTYSFCHRFNYGTTIAEGTVFAAGEVKSFTLPGLNAADSDLWLYRPGSFGSTEAIISGLKWGPASGVGRTSVAMGASIWDASVTVPTPATGQALRLTGENPFNAANWSGETNTVAVTFTLSNNAPDNGVFLTPVWLGVHDGTFDLFTSGEASTAGLERLAEDGNTAPLSAEFAGSSGAGLDLTVAATDGVPPFAPGESATITLTLDASNPKHRYLSFASMVIPSNDAFIGNSNPTAYPIFDESGNVIISSVLRVGADVYDAGTEVNDEIPANTAFFGQAAPDTGTVESGVVALHPGFDPASSGGILGDAMFANADFTAADYAIFSLGVRGPFEITEATLDGDVYSLTWEGGQAPFQIQWSRDLQNWTNAGGVTNDRTIEIEMTLVDRAFFRVIQRVAPQTAMFELTFDSTWSEETHPTDFPSGNPHFSGLIGATHNANDSLWSPGGLATPGIRNMAETGGKSPLDAEIDDLIAGGNTDSEVSGGGIGRSPGQASVQFEADQDFPLLSVVSMIAPSPDWFVGVHDLSLFENEQWIEELVVNLDAYDAGTDDGGTYGSSNAETTPQGTISRIVAPTPLAVDGVVASFGTFTIRRINP